MGVGQELIRVVPFSKSRNRRPGFKLQQPARVTFFSDFFCRKFHKFLATNFRRPLELPLLLQITSTQCFGMLVRKPLPALCEFPIYTRSGEVFVDTVHLRDNVCLSPEEKDLIHTFHKYTFTTVLRFALKYICLLYTSPSPRD